jgi:hypothetical protein
MNYANLSMDTEGTPFPLYRIYENSNQKAIREGEPLLIVEGEGKVNLLMDIQLKAR